ncbi:MAG: hypothetical protein K6F35_01510 [Lachnospiraceae bacterium]|nr:hypothetical protein [Lachnospiraceae bacterium]
MKKNDNWKMLKMFSAAVSAAATLSVTGLVLPCDAFAGQEIIRAVNERGYPVCFNEHNYAVNAGSVCFELNESALGKGECFVYEDGGMTLPVEDGKYVMLPPEGEEYGYVMFYICSKGVLKPLSSEPYVVEFKDSVSIAPKVSLSMGTEIADPFIKASPRAWVDTFVRIKSDTESALYHITEKDTMIPFTEDGIYQIRAFTMDGRGNKTYAENLQEEVIRDSGQPEIREVVLDGRKTKEDLVYRGDLTIHVTAEDSLSGVSSVFIDPGDGNIYETNELTIKSPYRGNVSIWAVDRAGNRSETASFEKEIIADGEEPEIMAREAGIEDGKLGLELEARDEHSGIQSLTAKIKEKELLDTDRDKEKLWIDLKSLPVGETEVEIKATDRAGNTAESTMTLERRDDTPPQIRFAGVNPYGLYGDPAEVRAEVTDDSGELKNAYLYAEIRGKDGKVTRSGPDEGMNMRFTESGEIMVTAVAEDMEGNRDEKSIVFTIDRDAPEIGGVEELDGKVLKEMSLAVSEEEMIQDMSYVNYEMYLNGLEYDGSPVTKEGKYVLKISARDELGNQSQKSASFTIKEEKKETVSVDLVQRNAGAPGSGIGEPVVVRFEQKKEKAETPSRVMAAAVSAPPTGELPEKEPGLWEKLKYAIMRLFQKPFRL